MSSSMTSATTTASASTTVTQTVSHGLIVQMTFAGGASSREGVGVTCVRRWRKHPDECTPDRALMK